MNNRIPHASPAHWKTSEKMESRLPLPLDPARQARVRQLMGEVTYARTRPRNTEENRPQG